MSDATPPTWLREVAPGPQPPPVGPLPRPAELTPVRRAEKAPRTPLRRVGPRRAEKRSRQYAEQAQRCREAPCCCCGVKGQSEPHHWPTIAAGGLDRDTCPLCPSCHDVFHTQAGSPEAFLALMGCDIYAAIQAMRRKPDHSCERFAVLREDGTPGRERSEYVVPQEQEGEDA